MRKKINFTPEMDREITVLYSNITGKGEVRTVSRKLNVPRWAIRRRALLLGVAQSRFKEPNWSEAEIYLLIRNAQFHPETIARKFRQKGYKRSVTAITLKRKRLRLCKNLEGYSATTLALAFGVNSKTISYWIEKKYLYATRRGTNRTPQQGGDEWWITESNIRKFIIENIHIIDIHKIDKYWMVDILTNGGKKWKTS